MYSLTAPSAFFPSSVFGTIIMSSIIKLSAESTSPSWIEQTNSTDSPSPVSEEERLQYLAELQTATTITEIPAMVFLFILAIVGLIGNSLVIFVYSLKFKQSATRVLIISIAVFDIVANVLAIPGDIYDMFHIWDFDNPALCRGRLFFSAFTTLSSAIALLAIAVVRYRKICTPHHWQITVGKGQVISVVVAFLGIIFSIPYAIINGRRTKETPRPGLVGYECTTDDSYFDTKWPLLNYGFFLVLFICCGTALTVLYILVGVQAWKHRKRHKNSKPSVSTSKTKIIPSPSGEINQSQESQVTNSSSERVDNGGQLGSLESLDIISNTDGSSHNKQFNEIVEQVDQYTVRIFHDRVEIRTPMMGEMIVNLQLATSGLESVVDNHTITENVQTTNIETNRNLDRDIDCVLPTCDHEADHQVQVGPIRATQSDLGCSDVNVDDRRIDTSIGSEKIDCSQTSRRKEIKPTSVSTLLTEQRTYSQSSDTERRTDPLSSHTEQRTDQSTFTASSEVTGDQNQDLNFGPTTPTSCTDPWKETISDKHQLTSDKHSLTSDKNSLTSDKHQLTSDKHSLTSDKHFDPVAALKWVDIVYSPEEDQTRADVDTPKTGNSFTFRISPTNNLLQKADWLRNVIGEALAKSRSRQVRSEEDAELNKEEKVEITILEDEDTANMNDNQCEHNSSVEHTQLRSTIPFTNRIKKLISQRSSILKASERRRSKGQLVSRTTVMLIIISAIYILGFIPHLGIMFYKYIEPEQVASIGTAGATVLNLFARSFFLNCAANPIIYSLCNKNFRRECIGVFKCFSRG